VPVRSKRQIDRALRKKGFDRRHSHHVFYWLTVDGKTSEVFTRMSQGRGEVGSALIARMARQCRLSTNEFLSLVDCPMTGNAYVERLEAGGYIVR